jgi:AcrR family transcriptional regulator
MASGRRTRQDFYDAAFAVLEESGFPALTVSALCERLAVTRGSFYHHFDSFESFVIGLLADWETRYSRELITRAETVTDLVGRLRYHIELAVALPHGAEAALRAWAAVDRNVATAQSRIDQVRYDYLARLLLAMRPVSQADLVPLARTMRRCMVQVAANEDTILRASSPAG